MIGKAYSCCKGLHVVVGHCCVMATLRSSQGQCLQGDGAGVGKGRQIAALFKDHFRKSGGGNTRGLWVSVRP